VNSDDRGRGVTGLLRKRVCRSFNFELLCRFYAATDDSSLWLSLGTHDILSFRRLVLSVSLPEQAQTVRDFWCLMALLLYSSMLSLSRWRWNATTRAGAAFVIGRDAKVLGAMQRHGAGRTDCRGVCARPTACHGTTIAATEQCPGRTA